MKKYNVYLRAPNGRVSHLSVREKDAKTARKVFLEELKKRDPKKFATHDIVGFELESETRGGGGANMVHDMSYYASGGGGARSKKKIRSLTLIERVWRDKTYGNNYATVEILINGEFAVKLPRSYGSGSMSEDRAVEWLDKNGYVKAPVRAHGGRQPLWQLAKDNGFTRNIETFNVLKRDL